MKRFFTIMLILVSLTINAKPARFYYYCMEQSQESVVDDGFIRVEYVLKSNFKNYTIPGVGSVDYAHPIVEISVKNISQTRIVIDTHNSTLMRNTHKAQFTDLTLVGNDVILSAGETKTFCFDIITKECLFDISNIFSYTKIPMIGEVPTGKLLNIQVREHASYSEEESLFKLASQIIYNAEGETDQYAVTTSYYLETIVGIPYNGFGIPKKEEFAEIFPDGMSDKYETFLLITSKK